MRFPAFTLACCLSLGGCAVWTPQIRVTQPTLASDPLLYGTLPAAIDAANAHIGKYQDAVDDHTHLRNTTTLVLVPLTAFTLYRGLTTAATHEHNLLALGAGGAAIYQGGGMFFSNARQRIYVEGMRATNCAINASRPYLMTRTGYEGLENGNKAIVAAKGQVEAAIGDLLRLSADAALDTKWEQRIKTEVRRARGSISRADTSLALTDVSLKHINLAGARLRGTVETINVNVSRELVKTELDWSALGKLSEGITKSMANFSVPERTESGTAKDLPAETGGGPESAGGTGGEARRMARQRIETRLAKLAVATDGLASSVNRQNALLRELAEMSKLAAEQVRQCDPGVVEQALDVMPSAATLTLSKTVPMRSLFVKNGAVSWPPAGSGAESLELQAAGSNQYIVQFKGLKPPAEEAEARLTIVGNNGEQRFVDLVLEAAPPDEPAPVADSRGAAAPSAPAAAPAKPALDKSIVHCVQEKIGMPEDQRDGKEGVITSAAVAAYAKANQLPENVGLSAPLLNKLGCAPKT